MMKPRLLLVDDHPVVLAGVQRDLANQQQLEIVGQATDRESALEAVRRLKPNLVLMDIHLGNENGIDVSRQILSKCPGIAIIVFSGDADPVTVDKALQAGVLGYLLKSCQTEELLRAIQHVMSGKLYMCPDVANQVFHGYRKILAAKQNEPALTEHEIHVLKLLSEGLRHKEAAAQLGVSTKAVERTRARIMAKLGYSSVAELARYAAREGIVSK